jgi:hypothetical protein
MDITLGLMLWLGGFSAGGVGGYYLKGLFEDYRSAESGRLYDTEQRHSPASMGP